MEKNTRTIFNLNIKKLRTLVIALFVILTSFSTVTHVSKSATILTEHIHDCDDTPPEEKISIDNPEIPITSHNNSPLLRRPNTPSVPTGPATLLIGESGMYSTTTVDPDNDTVQYRFDWNADGTHEYSRWSSLVASGQSVNMSHSWSSTGTYLVCALARDEHGSTSTWSTGLTVTVTGGTDLLDQESTRYDKANTIFLTRWSAQSFKPSSGILTKVTLYVGKAGSPSSDLVVSVRSSLYGADLTSVVKSSGSISSRLSWVECDFTDISVTPSSTYYLMVRTSDGNAKKGYLWGFGYYNPYPNGSFWMSTNSGLSWTEYATYDFCFQTYGRSGGNSPPNVPATPSGPVSRIVGEPGIYSTSAVDPDGDQMQYRFNWNASGTHEYSGWTTLVSSNKSVNMSHVWINAGTYLVRTQAKDEYGNEGSWSSSLTVTVAVSNSPPYVPSSPNPENHATGVVVNADLSWTGGDPNGDIVTYDVYFGTTNPPLKFSSNHTVTSFNPGLMNYTAQYYWKIIAWDNYNSSTPGPLWNFTTVPPGTNNPPNQTINPHPANGTTDVDINTVLSWSGGDPDEGDTVTYDVYFGTTISPGKVASNQSDTTYSPGTLQYITEYYWKIIAWDTHGYSRAGPLWGFTTKTSSGGGGGGGGGTTNIPPVADLSAGEPYRGIVGENIIFDGSKSHDPDGKIISWYWTFGDGTNSTEKNVTHHTYAYAGLFIVKLTITDNQRATNTKITNATITKPNRPPSQPTLVGPRTGTVNTSYTYTATSTDPDNSSLTYTFDWGDTTSNLTLAVPSGAPVMVNHTWTSAGVYHITVTASDGVTVSPTSITVLISVEYTGDIGYLIDHNGDGTYDTFYSNTTKNETKVEKQGNGTYYIDNDADHNWDYIYDPQTKKLTLYPTKDEETTQNDMSLWILGGILGIIVVLLLIVLLLTRKKKNKPTQSSVQSVESEKPVVETQVSKKSTTKRPRKTTKK